MRLQLSCDLLDDPASQVPEPDHDQAVFSLAGPRAASNMTHRDNPIVMAIHRASSVDDGGNVTSLAVSVTGNSISLSRDSAATSSTTRLCAIPDIPGIEATRQELIFPRFDGDMMKISVDKFPKSSYNLIEQTRGEVPPAVIERDLKFVSLPPSILLSVLGEIDMRSDPHSPGANDAPPQMLIDSGTKVNSSLSGGVDRARILLEAETARGDPPEAEEQYPLNSGVDSNNLPSSHRSILIEDSEQSKTSIPAGYLLTEEEEETSRESGWDMVYDEAEEWADSDVLEIPIRKNRFTLP